MINDHTVYSKRGTLWTDLVWKSALLYKCEILEDLLPEKGTGGRTDHLSIYDHMEQCGIPPFPCSHRLVWHPFENDVSFSCPLLHFPQPHWGVFMSLEMEGFWPSFTGPNIPPGCNGCWIPRHHIWTLPGRIRHTNRFFPRCLAREDIRCDVDENMWPGRLDYIHLFYSSVGFSVCIFT